MLEANIRISGSHESVKRTVEKLEATGFMIVSDSGMVKSRHEKKKNPEEQKKKRYITVEFK